MHLHLKYLDDKYYKNYSDLFEEKIEKYVTICSKLLFTYFYGDEQCNYYNINNNYLDKIFKIKQKTSKGNPSHNYQSFIVKNHIKKDKSLIISSISSIIYKINLDFDIKFDVFLLFNYYDDLKKKIDKINTYKKMVNIENLFSSHLKENYIQTLKAVQKNSLSIPQYTLITCHYDYIKGLSLNASYRFLLSIPDIIPSLGIALKCLEQGGTLLLFWTIINIQVPSVRKILTLLAFAFESIRVVTDDINQNFFQGVTEYYLVCTGYKANLSNELINCLLEVGIKSINYTYEICQILDYYKHYSRENPEQCLFYKNSPSIEHKYRQTQTSSTSLKSIKSKTIKSKTKKSANLSISKFLQSSRNSIQKKHSSKHSKHLLEPIKYIEDFDLPNAEWSAIQADSQTTYKSMILANRLESIFIEFFEKANSMMANDLEIDDSTGKITVKPIAIAQRKMNDIRRYVTMLETNNIAYNKHILTILKEQEDELVGHFYNLDNTVNTTLIRYRDETSRNRLKRNYNEFKLCRGFESPIINVYFDRINLAYRVKENLLKTLDSGEQEPEIVKMGYEDFTRGLSKYISQRYSDILPAIKASNAFTKLWEILSTFESLIPSRKSSTKYRVFHICEAPGQMILSLKYFIEKKRRSITDYDWLANSLNPFNAQVAKNYGSVFGDTYGVIKTNPQRWIWGADGTGDVTNVKNIKWYRDYVQKKMPDLNIIVGDGGLSTFTGAGLDPFILQRLDLAQAVMVLACSRVGGACIIKHFTPYVKRHTSTYEASGFFLGFIYMYYVAFDSVHLFKPYTSAPNSGEFYVVGEGFRGITTQELERFYKILEDFQVNQGIIPEDAMPETYIAQINGFLERMSDMNTMAIEKQNLLLTCYKDGENEKIKKYLKCDRFLDKDRLQEIQIPRFEEWIKKYKFV